MKLIDFDEIELEDREVAEQIKEPVLDVLEKRPVSSVEKKEYRDEAEETEAGDTENSAEEEIVYVSLDRLQKIKSPFEREFKDMQVTLPSSYGEQKSPKKKEKGKKREFAGKEIVSIILIVCVVFLVSVLWVSFVAQRTEVNGSSMENTLQDGDNLVINKLLYRFTDPKRFDIVVFPYSNVFGEEVFYIKRVIALPGETIQIINGYIYINGELLEEEYGKDRMPMVNAGYAYAPIELGEDEYFVLGDNRNNSSDSREIGVIKRSEIIGKTTFRLWPLSEFGKIGE